ncbi:hypothetical protein [Burkholderia sp. L27(2015)]|uniref:hypothetical protein n=1 Tax=Burkholderia sp. L27(2015) TaxID=1641858 RepID=UPI00131D0FB1|nr:hypothetical protein [Burkholderia sp. L27(2015)]
MMKKITIETAKGDNVSFNVRKIDGTPPQGVGVVYELVDASGKRQPNSLDNWNSKNRVIGFFDCIEVLEETGYAYRFLTKERVVEIGRVVTLD